VSPAQSLGGDLAQCHEDDSSSNAAATQQQQRERQRQQQQIQHCTSLVAKDLQG